MAGQPEQGEAKKLTEAVEYWAASGKRDDRGLADDAAAFRIELAEDEPDDFEVWPENIDAVVMWCRVQTQWRTTGMGVCGLDYSVLPWLFSMYDVSDSRQLLEDLQVMEAAALSILNKEA